MGRFALFQLVALVLAAGLAGAVLAGDAASATAPLGSPKYYPSVDRPNGWRGDGSGRYPGATPPLTWERTKSGAAYTNKGILWMTPLPNPNLGVSTPIIVGERIFLTAEPTDLVCLDKASGRVLWIRSNSEFEGLTDETRAESPAFKEKLAPLAEQLVKANADVVTALNAGAGAPATGMLKVTAAQNKKREIEGKIDTEQMAIDKKKFERYWAQKVFGLAGPTAVSDGKHVCVFFTSGITACYDLEGNRKWIALGKGGGAEHGNFASPIICGNTVAVWAHEIRGYDIETGKLLWNNPARGNNNYGSMFRIQVGNDLVAAFQYGYFVRVRDGKLIWDQGGLFGDSVMTPIVENGVVYATVGYPKGGNDTNGFRAYKIPASTDSGKLAQSFIFKTEWGADEVPIVKDKKPFERGVVASALLVDGLIYRMTEGGGLIVNDAANGEIIYRKVLPMKPRTSYWQWAGASTSPTLGGKNIYLMDNQGTTVVIAPGKEYKELAKNVLEESTDGKEQDQNLATPVFEDTRLYYRTPGYLYCIGEK